MSRTKPKFPKGAKKVFTGEVYDVWQWPQKLYDGSIATFEGVARPDTVEIIAVVGNKIILQDEQQPTEGKFVTIPCGRIDEGEKPLETAKRELREETGYTSKHWKLWYKRVRAGAIDWTVNTFIARDCTKTHDAKPDPGEIIKPRLVTFEQFVREANNLRFRAKSFQQLLLRAQHDKTFYSKLKKDIFGV